MGSNSDGASTMSGLVDHGGAAGGRRVRHGVRDGLVVMAFSAAASSAVALLLLALSHLAAGN